MINNRLEKSQRDTHQNTFSEATRQSLFALFQRLIINNPRLQSVLDFGRGFSFFRNYYYPRYYDVRYAVVPSTTQRYSTRRRRT